MSLVRLLVPELPSAGEIVTLAAAQGHHLVRVRRKAAGDAVILQTPRGQRAKGDVVSAEGDNVLVRCLEIMPEVAGVLPVHLYPALLPDSAFTLLLQKATEVGVKDITPVITEFTVARADKEEKKMARWQKICDEAACQCGGVPAQIMAPMKFSEVLSQGPKGLGLLADASGEPLSSFEDGIAEVSLLIGPEGGHSCREMEEALAAGFKKAAFHPFIMRAETAATVCAVLCQARWGGLA